MDISERPVALPPGCARVLTSPLLTGSGSNTNTIWYRVGGLLGLPRAQRGDGQNYVNFAFDELPCKRAKPVRLLGRKAMLQLNVLAVDVTEVSECLAHYG